MNDRENRAWAREQNRASREGRLLSRSIMAFPGRGWLPFPKRGRRYGIHTRPKGEKKGK